jgi:group I intron endonuclease
VGLIYKVRNIVNNKYYIGQTSKTFEERKKAHLRSYKYTHKYNFLFYRAIRKYGEENFEFSVVEDDIPAEFLNIKESEYIQIFNSFRRVIILQQVEIAILIQK